MIKNENQLKSSQDRLIHIVKEISIIKAEYSGIDFDIFATPLLEEKTKIEQEITEYELLRKYDIDDIFAKKIIEPHLLDNIGELLSKLRIASKINQSELAEKLGWTQPNTSRFESENYNAQSIKKIIEYSSALGIWLRVFPTLVDEEENVEVSVVPRNLVPKRNLPIKTFSSWGTDDSDFTLTTDSKKTVHKTNEDFAYA